MNKSRNKCLCSYSIIKYTGNGSSTQYVPHGLNETPDIIWHKNLSASANWLVRTTVIDGTIDYNEFTNAAFSNAGGDYTNAWTSTKFSIGSDSQSNTNAQSYIAYCWHSVPGYSKIDRFKGNNNVDGQVINLGFRPAWLMLKRTDQASEWNIYDINRNVGEQPLAREIRANRNYTESGYDATRYVDFLSYGFKMRTNDSDHNADGGTYIYMAFAEQPGITPYGTETNAR